MKHTKYSVLLMRDDSNVRRFRVSPIWLKLGVYAIICLVLLAAGGIVAGYTFWDKNQVLAESRKKMERRLVEMQVRLERLENVQKLLEGTDPEDLTALAGTVGRKPVPTMPEPEIHLKRLFNPKDMHIAKVENIQVQFVNHSMRVNFEINNLQPNKSLAGDVVFALITNAGKQLKVDATSQHLNFSIQRFKRIITKFHLPKDVARDDIFALQVKIVSPTGDMVFSDTFPIYRIVS